MKEVLLPYKGILPTIGESVFIAPTARAIGDVHIGKNSSLWFGVTVRGDVNHIRIGEDTNIQDHTMVHVTRVTHPTVIGSRVTIGHSVTLHGCTLEDECFVGMAACIMDGAVIESGAMVAAGALVTPGKRVKTGEIWAGNPAKFMRPMTDKEKAHLIVSANNYVRLSHEYLQENPSNIRAL